MDLELTTQNKLTKEVTAILLRDVPDDTTQGELKRYFKLYGGPDQELIGFAKVTFESGNEQKALDE